MDKRKQTLTPPLYCGFLAPPFAIPLIAPLQDDSYTRFIRVHEQCGTGDNLKKRPRRALTKRTTQNLQAMVQGNGMTVSSKRRRVLVAAVS